MALSGHQLIAHLGRAQSQLLQGLEFGEERYRSAYFDLELLPYALGAAWNALSECARQQCALVATFPPERLKGLAFFGLPSEQRDTLSYACDAFLDAARRAQNAVIHYLGRGLRMSLPSSMHDLVQDLEKSKISFPQNLHDGILKYWNEHGRRLKDYRDLAQHHALVTSDARILCDENGRVGLYLLLPSNPEVKSAGRLSFGNPDVHVLPYVKREFKELVVVLSWITRGLLSDAAGCASQISPHVFRDPAELGPGIRHSGYVPPTPEALEDEIRSYIERFRVK